MRELVADALAREGYRVETVSDGQAAVERVSRGDISLVLLDVVMPRMGGQEACRLIKGMNRQVFLPVILVTVKTDSASRVEGLRIGADDYVSKPVEEAELLARVESLLRLKGLHDEAVRAKERFEQLTVFDERTGLYNYRYLRTRLEEEFRRAERYAQPLACILVDIDQLGAVNDRRGRSLGDRVLTMTAGKVKSALRDVDVCARFGGDEILVLLPNTHLPGAMIAADRLWDAGAWALTSEEGDLAWDVTVSVGVALFPSPDVHSSESLVRAADRALQEAKAAGGNRVCTFHQEGTILDGPSGRPSLQVPAIDTEVSSLASLNVTLVPGSDEGTS